MEADDDEEEDEDEVDIVWCGVVVDDDEADSCGVDDLAVKCRLLLSASASFDFEKKN